MPWLQNGFDQIYRNNYFVNIHAECLWVAAVIPWIWDMFLIRVHCVVFTWITHERNVLPCFWLIPNLFINCVRFFGTLIAGSALECYVCSNQTDNTEKCLNTIRTCEQGEDVCLTEIRWGSQPYFSQGALKQYYVSKRCSTKQLCQRIRSKYMPYCTHIWYEDWTCSECCQGDRCNYFVIVSIPQCWHCDNSHEFTCFFFLVSFAFQSGSPRFHGSWIVGLVPFILWLVRS